MIDYGMRLVKSPFIQIAREDGNAVIWHSLFGNPKIVSGETLVFLDFFTRPTTLLRVISENKLSEEEEEMIKELCNDFYLVPPEFDARRFLAERMREREKTIINGSLINYLSLIVSEACNFRCAYCFHFNNLETSDRLQDPTKLMSFEAAKQAVDCFVAILRQHGKLEAEINFGGGEALLNWPVIEQTLHYCVSTYGREFTFRFSINTNASLITPEIAQGLKGYKVEVAPSLDGPQEGNDLVRLTQLGRGTFDLIVAGFNHLAAQDYPVEGFSATVNERNFPYLDERIIDWAEKRSIKEVRIDIDVINMVEIPIDDIVERLMRIRRYAKERGIVIPGFWARPAENLNNSTLEAHVSFCGAVRGNSLCVNPSGDIYSCGYSTVRLGNLVHIDSFYTAGSDYHRFVKDRLTGMMAMCQGCMIEGQCGGGCNITQEFSRSMQTTKIERMCEFYCRMTQELLLEQLRETVCT